MFFMKETAECILQALFTFFSGRVLHVPLLSCYFEMDGNTNLFSVRKHLLIRDDLKAEGREEADFTLPTITETNNLNS